MSRRENRNEMVLSCLHSALSFVGPMHEGRDVLEGKRRLLAAKEGCWLLTVSSWLLAAGWRLSTADCWLLLADCWQPGKLPADCWQFGRLAGGWLAGWLAALHYYLAAYNAAPAC